MNVALEKLVGAELGLSVDRQVAKMATALAARYPHAARAVLFYGSCLREARLDGLMLDFYLIVSDYRAAYGQGWLAAANRLIPPNVFPFSFSGMQAKFAILSEEDFYRLCGPEADNVSVWARFAQPARLVWSADDAATRHAVRSVARAAPTLIGLAVPTMLQGRDHAVLDIWKAGFAHTYSAELRAERQSRSGSVVDIDPARYEAFGRAALEDLACSPDLAITPARAARRWRSLRRRGKWLSVVRLAKASFTFAGGIDYLAWKINRHAGAGITIQPWHRRWPLLAAVILLPRLLLRGSVR